MLDGTEYFECQCGSDEHTLRFILNKDDNEIYTHVYLGNHHTFFQRLKLGIKYIFGYSCKYGHFNSWIMRNEDASRLKNILDKLEDRT